MRCQCAVHIWMYVGCRQNGFRSLAVQKMTRLSFTHVGTTAWRKNKGMLHEAEMFKQLSRYKLLLIGSLRLTNLPTVRGKAGSLFQNKQMI